jgi:hypothetical protein
MVLALGSGSTSRGVPAPRSDSGSTEHRSTTFGSAACSSSRDRPGRAHAAGGDGHTVRPGVHPPPAPRRASRPSRGDLRRRGRSRRPRRPARVLVLTAAAAPNRRRPCSNPGSESLALVQYRRGRPDDRCLTATGRVLHPCPGRATAAAPTRMILPLQWPLVGRHAEIERLMTTLAPRRRTGLSSMAPLRSARPGSPITSSLWQTQRAQRRPCRRQPDGGTFSRCGAILADGLVAGLHPFDPPTDSRDRSALLNGAAPANLRLDAARGSTTA